jgi:hypothetical protein
MLDFHSKADFQSLDALAVQTDRSWWNIYEQSFPAAEREKPEAIIASITSGVGRAIAMRLAGETRGMATLHVLHNPAASFLVYLAIDAPQRDAGWGGRLFEYAFESGVRALKEQGHSPLGCVWEVDMPELAATREERACRERRIAFFMRHGGAVLPIRYAQPPLDGKQPLPMHLMFKPDRSGSWPDARAQEAIVRAMYFEKYEAVNRIPGPVLKALLEDLSAQR